jgi:hypothetical protein
VDLGKVHADFTKSGASGAPGPQVAVAVFLHAVAKGDTKAYFTVTGSKVTAAALTSVRRAVFGRYKPFTVTEVWNNVGVGDGKGSIVRAVAETSKGRFFQTTLRVNTVRDRDWFVSQATGTGGPPAPAIRAAIDAEVLKRLRSRAEAPVACAKPVIYLYPTRTTRVRVRLDVGGTITASAPDYDPIARGWDVIAAPDGRLTDPATGRTWPYLFWEADARLVCGTEGDVVAGTDTVAFLRSKLARLGLSASESTSFIEYWSPRMRGNRYNFVRFEGAAYERMATLSVTPRPNTVIRVLMTFAPLDVPVHTTPQLLRAPPARRGFTVVEWGGREVPRR